MGAKWLECILIIHTYVVNQQMHSGKISFNLYC